MTQHTQDKSEIVNWKLKIDKDIKEEGMHVIMSTTENSHIGRQSITSRCQNK